MSQFTSMMVGKSSVLSPDSGLWEGLPSPSSCTCPGSASSGSWWPSDSTVLSASSVGRDTRLWDTFYIWCYCPCFLYSRSYRSSCFSLFRLSLWFGVVVWRWTFLGTGKFSGWRHGGLSVHSAGADRHSAVWDHLLGASDLCTASPSSQASPSALRLNHHGPREVCYRHSSASLPPGLCLVAQPPVLVYTQVFWPQRHQACDGSRQGRFALCLSQLVQDFRPRQARARTASCRRPVLFLRWALVDDDRLAAPLSNGAVRERFSLARPLCSSHFLPSHGVEVRGRLLSARAFAQPPSLIGMASTWLGLHPSFGPRIPHGISSRVQPLRWGSPRQTGTSSEDGQQEAATHMQGQPSIRSWTYRGLSCVNSTLFFSQTLSEKQSRSLSSNSTWWIAKLSPQSSHRL